MKKSITKVCLMTVLGCISLVTFAQEDCTKMKWAEGTDSTKIKNSAQKWYEMKKKWARQIESLKTGPVNDSMVRFKKEYNQYAGELNVILDKCIEAVQKKKPGAIWDANGYLTVNYKNQIEKNLLELGKLYAGLNPEPGIDKGKKRESFDPQLWLSVMQLVLPLVEQERMKAQIEKFDCLKMPLWN